MLGSFEIWILCLAEYVLIGTLWSFSLAIAIAYLTFYLLP